MGSDDDMLDERQVAPLLGVAPRTVQRMRAEGYGPPFHRYSNRLVRYRRGDVREYLAAHREVAMSA